MRKAKGKYKVFRIEFPKGEFYYGMSGERKLENRINTIKGDAANPTYEYFKEYGVERTIIRVLKTTNDKVEALDFLNELLEEGKYSGNQLNNIRKKQNFNIVFE